jgi:hypothetical protein
LDTNFVVCSVGTVPTEGVVTVIPFTNTYATATEKHTSELTALVHADWAWKIVLVIGTDRNMFGVGFYPVQEDLDISVNFLAETSGNIFFTADTPV